MLGPEPMLDPEAPLAKPLQPVGTDDTVGQLETQPDQCAYSGTMGTHASSGTTRSLLQAAPSVLPDWDIFHNDTDHLGVNASHPSFLDWNRLSNAKPWSESLHLTPFSSQRLRLPIHTNLLKRFPGFGIIANAVFIFVMEYGIVESALNGEQDAPPTAYLVANDLLVALLALELGLHCLYQGPRVWGKAWIAWTVFDIFVMGVSAFQAVTKSRSGRHIRGAAFLRLLRLPRLVHIMPKLHTLRLFVTMTRASLPAFCWAFLALTNFVFVYCVFLSTYLVTMIQRGGIELDRLESNGYRDVEAWERDIRLMYQDLPTTMWTLFGSIAGGLDWLAAARPLRALRFGGQIYASFVLFVFLTMYCLSNILIATMVGTAQDVLAMDRDVVIHREINNQQAQGTKLYGIFSRADQDNTGTISRAELDEALRDKSVIAYLHSLGVSFAEVWGVFNLLPKDSSGDVEITLLIEKIFILRGPSKNVDLVSLIYAQRRSARLLDRFQQDVAQRLDRLEGSIVGSDCDFSRRPSASGKLTPLRLRTSTGASQRRAPSITQVDSPCCATLSPDDVAFASQQPSRSLARNGSGPVCRRVDL